MFKVTPSKHLQMFPASPSPVIRTSPGTQDEVITLIGQRLQIDPFLRQMSRDGRRPKPPMWLLLGFIASHPLGRVLAGIPALLFMRN